MRPEKMRHPRLSKGRWLPEKLVISCMRRMVFMVVEGATIKPLFEVLMSCHVARSYHESILISP